MPKTRQFIVMRRPCLMEDEGRSHFIGTTDSKEAAQKLIAKEVKESGGYFSAFDYQIFSEERTSKN